MIEGYSDWETPEERDRRARLIGYEYKRLPEAIRARVVLGRDRNMKVIQVDEVEKVFNDCFLIDFVRGAGTYLRHTGQRQEDVLKLAFQLFGAQAEENRAKLVEVSGDH